MTKRKIIRANVFNIVLINVQCFYLLWGQICLVPKTGNSGIIGNGRLREWKVPVSLKMVGKGNGKLLER
jgi:hypothetical protein